MQLWTRMSEDDIFRASPSEQSEVIGVVLRTYGVKLLEESGEYYQVFSPDMNRNGYVKKEKVLSVDYFAE